MRHMRMYLCLLFVVKLFALATSMFQVGRNCCKQFPIVANVSENDSTCCILYIWLPIRAKWNWRVSNAPNVLIAIVQYYFPALSHTLQPIRTIYMDFFCPLESVCIRIYSDAYILIYAPTMTICKTKKSAPI